MYNIHSHYENIFHLLKDIVTYPRLLCLMPYGSTQPENLERMSVDISNFFGFVTDGPMWLFYDQEPILGEFNYRLIDYVKDNCQAPFILVTTEKDSDPLDLIKQKYNWPTVYYFHHAFAAHDWFRGYRYDTRMVEPRCRKLVKKYISFNRLTSNARVYRSLLISNLVKHDLLADGYVSYNDTCPDGGTYINNLHQAVCDNRITHKQAEEAIDNIAQAPLPLRIDYQDQALIPNHSFLLSAVEQTQESFCYVVTETCYWERKKHLTEKIFKPIVSKMPFILVGPAHNLKYLREYGFKTFSQWIDESYDDIEDPVERLNAVTKSIEKICNYSLEDLKAILVEMQPVLEHNYELFYSNTFLDYCWEELKTNLTNAVSQL